MTTLLKLETQKIFRTQAVWVFVILSILVNIVYGSVTSQKETIDYYNELSATAGAAYHKTFVEKLNIKKNAGTGQNNLFEDYKSAAYDACNVFEDLRDDTLQNQVDTSYFLSSSVSAQKIIKWKYKKLAPVIEEKFAADDGKSVYFADRTQEIHETVFTNFHKLLATELCLLFTLIMLLAIGYENMFGTESVIYTTKAGRNIVLPKMGAALVAAAGFGLILYFISACVLFTINDLSMVWGQNISAQYNTIYYPQWGVYPFISWDSMSIRAYFFRCAGVIFLQGLLCGLFSATLALLNRNVYITFCTLFGLVFLHFILLWNFDVSALLFDLLLVPTLTQILYCQWWFADGGPFMLIPHFETLYPLICIMLISPITMMAFRFFHKKELVSCR